MNENPSRILIHLLFQELNLSHGIADIIEVETLVLGDDKWFFERCCCAAEALFSWMSYISLQMSVIQVDLISRYHFSS